MTREDPVAVVKELTGGVGAGRVIDAVGIDAETPDGEHSPGQALRWAVQSVAEAGTVSVVDVYPQTFAEFPIGAAMMRNLSLNTGNCSHRKYLPELLDLVQTGRVDPTTVLTQTGALPDAVEAYRRFDKRTPGWTKVALTAG